MRQTARVPRAVPGDVVALLVVLGAAVVLRLSLLGARDVFRDEAASWLSAAYPWADIGSRMAGEPYPPLYFFALKAWMSLFGDDLAALRALSALAGIATVGIAYQWAREALGKWPAILAFLLVALSPLALDEARTARMYALETMFATGAWWLMWRAINGRGRRARRVVDLCLLALAVGGELWTMPTGVVTLGLQASLVAAVSVARLWSRSREHRPEPSHRSNLAATAAAMAVGAAAFLPWLPSLLAAATHSGGTWPQPSSIGGFWTALTSLFAGTVDSPARQIVPVLVVLVAIGLADLWAVDSMRRSLALACFLGGIGLMAGWWTLSLVRSEFDARYLGAALPPLAIAAAAGAARAWAWPLRAGHPRVGGAIAAAVVLTLTTGPAVIGVAWLSNAHLAPMREILDRLDRTVRSGDVVLAVDARSYFPLAYEMRDDPGMAARLWYWHRSREPGYFGGGLVDPSRTITEGSGEAAFSIPGLAADGSIWVVALTNGHWELKAFSPLADGHVAVQSELEIQTDDPPVAIYQLRRAGVATDAVRFSRGDR